MRVLHAVKIPADESAAQSEVRWQQMKQFVNRHRTELALDDWEESNIDFVISAVVCLPSILVFAEQISQAMAEEALSQDQN